MDLRERDLVGLIMSPRKMHLDVDALVLPLGEPFVSAKGATVSVSLVRVRIGWDGRIGHGVAVPAREYGTSEASLRATLTEFAPIISEHTPFDLEALLRRLEGVAAGQAAAVAAVDLALHDLLGQVAGLPVHRLFGLDGLPLPPTALSVGVMSIEALVSHTRSLAAWPILKLKMKRPDANLVARVRDVYSGRLWIDANGGWTPEEAVTAAERFARYDVELLEQPVPPGTPSALRFVHERAPLAIVADEDCLGPADVLALAGCAHAINIKLLKCGGLRRAFEMIALARRASLRVMLGCKTESVLGTTAIAQLGGLADFLDVDGHLDVLDDPYEGIAVDHGRVVLPSRPGLGARVRS